VSYKTRPLSDRAWLRPATERKVSQFKVSWPQALDLLDRELCMLDGRDLVIEVDVREQDLRLDGTLRANARASEPAVIVAFESKHGPLLYRSDQYEGAPYYRRGGMQEGWQHNVYAVALTLDALRAVDRYGAARSGEQYRGYRQIGGGPAIVPDAPMTQDRAKDVLIWSAHPDAQIPPVVTFDAAMIRLALRNTHPDTRHPKATFAFDEVQRAATLLRGVS
jgi:hypothetical protein